MKTQGCLRCRVSLRSWRLPAKTRDRSGCLWRSRTVGRQQVPRPRGSNWLCSGSPGPRDRCFAERVWRCRLDLPGPMEHQGKWVYSRSERDVGPNGGGGVTLTAEGTQQSRSPELDTTALPWGRWRGQGGTASTAWILEELLPSTRAKGCAEGAREPPGGVVRLHLA